MSHGHSIAQSSLFPTSMNLQFFRFFFDPEKVKKWASKVAHNRPRPFFPTFQPRPQPKIDFLYHEISGPDICSRSYLCSQPFDELFLIFPISNLQCSSSRQTVLIIFRRPDGNSVVEFANSVEQELVFNATNLIVTLPFMSLVVFLLVSLNFLNAKVPRFINRQHWRRSRFNFRQKTL